MRTIWICNLRERNVSTYIPAVESCSKQDSRPEPSILPRARAISWSRDGAQIQLIVADNASGWPEVQACNRIFWTIEICLQATSTLRDSFSFFTALSVSLIWRVRQSLGIQEDTIAARSKRGVQGISLFLRSLFPVGTSDGKEKFTQSIRATVNLACSPNVLPKLMSIASARRLDRDSGPVAPGISQACGMRRFIMALVPSGRCKVHNLNTSPASVRISVKFFPAERLKKHKIGRMSNIAQHLIHSLRCAIWRRHSSALRARSVFSTLTLKISEILCIQHSEVNSMPVDM